jgi:hypothetical protein
MKIDDAQKQRISGWIAEGAKLADIQKRIGTELGVSLTYMEVRLLVDDLKLVPKDTARPKDEKPTMLTAPAPAAGAAPGKALDAKPAPGAAPPDAVALNVDTMARPGTLVSGSVKFSDGQTAAWYLDEQGRLGVVPTQKGYKPSATDVEAFQRKLEQELSRIGY